VNTIKYQILSVNHKIENKRNLLNSTSTVQQQPVQVLMLFKILNIKQNSDCFNSKFSLNICLSSPSLSGRLLSQKVQSLTVGFKAKHTRALPTFQKSLAEFSTNYTNAYPIMFHIWKMTVSLATSRKFW